MVILNFRFFDVIDKLFINPRGDLDLPIFSRGRKEKFFFVKLTLFLSNVVTFYFKKQTS